MSELKPCEAIEILESIYPSKKQIVTGEYPEVAEALDMAIVTLRRAQPANARPPCYLPEKDNPYPLCIGRGMTVCAHCCLWADYDQDENESRVNHPLTLEELRGMDGEPVWLKDGIGEGWFLASAIVGEKIYFCEKSITVGEPITGCGKTWLAYRRPPQKG